MPFKYTIIDDQENLATYYHYCLVTQMLKNLPAMQKTRVRSMRPLEKEMTTHSSTLAWRIRWTEKPGGLQSMLFQIKHPELRQTLIFLFLCSFQYNSEKMKDFIGFWRHCNFPIFIAFLPPLCFCSVITSKTLKNAKDP